MPEQRFAETSEEVEVRKEDQERINEFGILHRSWTELDKDRKVLEEQLAYVEDAEQEVMLSSDDSETFLIQMGSTYVTVGEDEFNEFLESKKDLYEGKRNKIVAEMNEIETKKETLKATLYSRFGNTINLDD